MRILLGSVLTSSLLPVAAWAQSAIVVTVPAGQAVPTLGALALVFLAVALAAGAMYVMRRAQVGSLAQVALVAAIATITTVGYGSMANVVVSGGECSVRTEHEFNPNEPTLLENDCAGSIRIDSIEYFCEGGNESIAGGDDHLLLCEEGLVLPPNGSCSLAQGCDD